MAQVDQFKIDTFTQNVLLRYQQFGSRLSFAIMPEDIPSAGNRKFIRDYGPQSTFQELSNRHTNPDAVETERRNTLFTFKKYGKEELFDDLDELKNLLVEPNSSLVRNVVAAWGRTVDDVVLDNILGTVQRGGSSTGTLSSVAFPASQQVAVDFVESGGAVNSRITPGKLREAARLLDANEVPPDNRFIVLNAFQKRELLRTSEFRDQDFVNTFGTETGQLPGTLYGLTPIMSERLNEDGSSHTQVVAFHSESVRLGDTGLEVRAQEDMTKNYSTRFTALGHAGFTRTQEEGVVEIKCLAT